MLKHPSPTKCRELGHLFLNLHAANKERQVLMHSIEFNTCGTAACHAGWFAVAHNKNSNYLDDGNRCTYSSAGLDLSNFVFPHTPHPKDEQYFLGSLPIEKWAKEHPKLWGSSNGQAMFGSEGAFGGFGHVKLTLRFIGKWWLAVADRIEQELLNGAD